MIRFFWKKSRAANRVATGLVIILFALVCANLTSEALSTTPQQANNLRGSGDRLAVLKQFVGTWKGKSSPEMIAENILIFKIDGERLTGTERVFAIRDEGDGSGPKIVKDNFVLLPTITVDGKTLTWKAKRNREEEILRRVTLLGEDEILFETVGFERVSDQPDTLFSLSFKLKREK
jgi:hypothetical protein